MALPMAGGMFIAFSLRRCIARSSADTKSSVPLLPADTFPDLLWFYLVRVGPMDDSWNSPPQSKSLVYYWDPWNLVG